MHQVKTVARLTSLAYGAEGIKGLKKEVLLILENLSAARTPMTTSAVIPFILKALPIRFDGVENMVLPQMATISMDTLFTMLEAKEDSLNDKFKRTQAERAARKKPAAEKKLMTMSAGEGGSASKQRAPGGSNRPRPKGGKAAGLKCHNCQKMGHFARDCRAPLSPQQAEYLALKRKGAWEDGGNNKRVRWNPKPQVHQASSDFHNLTMGNQGSPPPPPPKPAQKSAPRSRRQ